MFELLILSVGVGVRSTAVPRARELPYVDPLKQRSRLYFAIARLSATKFGAWFSINVAWKLDPLLLKLSAGRLSTTGPLAAALLESRGARTGLPRRNATLYFHDGGRVTIVASKRGWSEHPAWYYNLSAHPDVVFGGVALRAELIDDEASERDSGGSPTASFPSTPTIASERRRPDARSRSFSWSRARASSRAALRRRGAFNAGVGPVDDAAEQLQRGSRDARRRGRVEQLAPATRRDADDLARHSRADFLFRRRRACDAGDQREPTLRIELHRFEHVARVRAFATGAAPELEVLAAERVGRRLALAFAQALDGVEAQCHPLAGADDDADRRFF